MNQDGYVGTIVINAIVALVIGLIITSLLYSVMYSVNGSELYVGFAILGAIYGFLFLKVDIFENNLDLIITNAVFAFFGTYVSINLLFTSALKVAMNSSLLTYQYALMAIIVAIVVNYIRDNYLGINLLGSLNLNLGKLPTIKCPKCGVEINASDIFCSECGYEFTHCSECGEKLDEDATFCPECGHKLKEDKSGKSKKDESKIDDSSKDDAKDNSKKDESKIDDSSKDDAKEDKSDKSSKEESDKKEDKVCSNCGSKLGKDAQFCQECGNKVED